MKKIICLLIASIMVLTISFGAITDTVSASSKKVEHLSVSLKPNMESISVKWKKRKNIKKYVIYRIDVTKDVMDQEKDYSFKMSQYKKIGEVSGKKRYYKDKRAKENHYYAYVVKAYKRGSGKYKLAYTSYNRDCYDYCCRGLGVPELLNEGSGEDYTNSVNCIYLYHHSYSGVDPTSVILYRKEKGESKYKTVNFKTVERSSNLAVVLKDTTVKPGKIYYYKIKTKKKYKGKNYYSKASNAIRIPAVNVIGKFNASGISVPDNPNEVIIKFTSDKYNGTLSVSQAKWPEDSEEGIHALGYSYDNVIWESMTGRRAVIKPGKTVYIKFGGEGASGKKEFVFDEEGERAFVSVSYDSPVFRPYIMTVDLVNNTAEAHPFYD